MNPVELLATLFVGHPLRCAAVAGVLFGGYLMLRRRFGPEQTVTRWMPAAVLTWSAFAIWEWVVLVRSPEANLRIDLLLIGPVVLIVTAMALWRSSQGLLKSRMD